MAQVEGLLQRLQAKKTILIAEGYLFEFERRGYLKAGAFVPEVVLEHPDLVRDLHREFVHAGSDVVEAFTYYGHRDKLRIIGREDDLEKLNRKALQIAREVAKETGTLLAGNICNSNLYNQDDPKLVAEVHDMFKEQVEWAAEEGAHYIIGETFYNMNEALLALECIKKYGKGLPAVITVVPAPAGVVSEGVKIPDACKALEDAGAAVVGINCYSGPKSMLPLIKEVKKVCRGPVACVFSPYRTTPEAPSFFNLRNPDTGEYDFPHNLDSWLCSRTDVAKMTKDLQNVGVQYMGLCCGNMAHYTRTMAETLGRHPPASKYSPDMKQHMTNIRDDKHLYISDLHKSMLYGK